MSFRVLLQKEIYDLAREKRFGSWALVYSAFWAFMLFWFLSDLNAAAVHRVESPMNGILEAPIYYYVTAIALMVLVLFVACDGIARDREAGTLPLVATTPVNRAHVLLAKLAAALVAYAGAAVLTFLPLAVLGIATGFLTLKLLVVLYAFPFLLLFVFLAGVGLLLGVALQSSKVAIGTGAAIFFPLFLMGAESPFERLYQLYPLLGEIARHTPFDAAYRTAAVVQYGGQVPWTPVAVTLLVGLGSIVLAFVLYSRQEAAA